MFMYPPVNLLHLKFFYDAVIYRSISESAKMNFVTQSAVSQAIDKLESIYKTKLVIHQRQKLALTDEGKIVFEEAEKIFQSVKNAFNQIDQIRDEIKGAVSFVTTKCLAMSFVPSTYKKVKEELPAIELKFKLGYIDSIRTYLKRGYDLAIVLDDRSFAAAEFQKIPLCKGKFNLYQSATAPKNPVSSKVFYLQENASYCELLKENLAKKGDFQFEAVGEWELAARFAELNMGLAFVPDYIVANNRHHLLRSCSVKIPKYEYEICAIHDKNLKLSNAAQEFLNRFTME